MKPFLTESIDTLDTLLYQNETSQLKASAALRRPTRVNSEIIMDTKAEMAPLLLNKKGSAYHPLVSQVNGRLKRSMLAAKNTLLSPGSFFRKIDIHHLNTRRLKLFPNILKLAHQSKTTLRNLRVHP